MKKGQIATTDLFLALLLFILLLSGISVFWTLYNSRQADILAANEIELAAFQIVDSLIRTQGYPIDWENDPNETLTIGLASSDRVLSKSKVDAFRNFTYNETRSLFKITEFDYRLIIQNQTATVLDTNTTFTGKVISLRRIVDYEGNYSTVTFMLGQ